MMVTTSVGMSLEYYTLNQRMNTLNRRNQPTCLHWTNKYGTRAWKFCLSGLHSFVSSTSLRRGLCNLWLDFVVASWSSTLLLHMFICPIFIHSCPFLFLYFYISVACSVFLILLSPPESYIESILIHVCLQFNLNLQVTTRWQQVYCYQTMWTEFCLQLICSLAVSDFPLQ